MQGSSSTLAVNLHLIYVKNLWRKRGVSGLTLISQLVCFYMGEIENYKSVAWSRALSRSQPWRRCRFPCSGTFTSQS